MRYYTFYIFIISILTACTWKNEIVFDIKNSSGLRIDSL